MDIAGGFRVQVDANLCAWVKSSLPTVYDHMRRSCVTSELAKYLDLWLTEENAPAELFAVYFIHHKRDDDRGSWIFFQFMRSKGYWGFRPPLEARIEPNEKLASEVARFLGERDVKVSMADYVSICDPERQYLEITKWLWPDRRVKHPSKLSLWMDLIGDDALPMTIDEFELMCVNANSASPPVWL